MPDKRKKNNNNNEIKNDPLWASFVEDIQPLKGKMRPKAPVPDQERPKIAAERVIHPEQEAKVQKIPQGRETDGNTHERLRKGKIRPQATLDLHGMTQNEAEKNLQRFIIQSHERGLRCVLVITGKGLFRANEDGQKEWFEPKTGVLKTQTPVWLNADSLRPYVLQFLPAQPKDGGEGALYVLLRKKR